MISLYPVSLLFTDNSKSVLATIEGLIKRKLVKSVLLLCHVRSSRRNFVISPLITIHRYTGTFEYFEILLIWNPKGTFGEIAVKLLSLLISPSLTIPRPISFPFLTALRVIQLHQLHPVVVFVLNLSQIKNSIGVHR